MKKILKFIILPILHLIRKILIILKTHTMPSYNPPLNPKSYIMFYNEEMISCYHHFKKYFYKSVFLEKKKLQEYSIQKALENDIEHNKFYLEFGVYNGKSINLFSKYLKKNKIYGFDSFEGLKEDWVGTHVVKNHFSLGGKIPKLNKNVVPIKGWIQNTLPKFIKEKKPSINFVHMDMDTYETSKFLLENIKPFLNKGSIILFDELYNFAGWKVGEYRALTEVFKENDYKFLAFSIDGTEATIQII